MKVEDGRIILEAGNDLSGITWTGAALPGWLFKALVLLVSLVIALPLTSLVVRPLGAFFVTRAKSPMGARRVYSEPVDRDT